MKKIVQPLSIAVFTCVMVLMLARLGLHAEEPASTQKLASDAAFTMKGTFVVTTVGASSEVIALIDPVFKPNAGTQFLVGQVSERTGYIQGTPFSGGMSYIPLDKIVSIQELKPKSL